MDELEYITKQALIMCTQGAAPDFFNPTFNTKVTIHDCLVSTNMDAAPFLNIPTFKVCLVTQKPCVPATVPMTWMNTWPVKVNGIETLIGRSTCQCPVGGSIYFMTSGQIPLPDDAMAEVQVLQDQAQRTLDDSGYGDSVGETGFAEGMIPLWGSGRDFVNDVQTGDVGGAILNAGFFVWDAVSIVAGVFSFGAGTAGMQGIKAGVKGAIKGGAKLISKQALKSLGKGAFKKLSKEALKKSVDDVAKKLLKTCVFACFPAGTLIHTQDGIKKIEEIQQGDHVWAFDEKTATVALQEVSYTMQREADHTIRIELDNETIETTAQHPFYTADGWKDASDLQAGDELYTKNYETVTVKATQFLYEAKKVYNFEVARWHNYFVGKLALLVHNAGKCISKIWKSVKKFGHTFSKHGEGLKNTEKLIGRAAGTGKNQGQWLSNDLAADFLENAAKNMGDDVTKTVIDIPKGLGQVIKPDGSIVESTTAIIVKNSSGGIKTAYPILP